jgi:hypothetical protein
MRTVYTIITILSVFAVACSQEDPDRIWTSNEITITLDSSLEDLGEDSYGIIEDAILTWTDHIDRDITVNFVYEDCTASPFYRGILAENCVIAVDDLNSEVDGKPVLGRAYVHNDDYDKNIINGDILFNRSADWRAFNLYSTALHEAGHFWGLGRHSEHPEDIMYEYVGGVDQVELSENDINRVQTLYN